jgi:uncharacterized cupredoxin-like copper-binding protein
MRRFCGAVAAATALITFVAAPSVAETSARTPAAKKGKPVTVQLYEFGVKPKPKFVAAGKVTFTAKNIGTMKHEMVLVRTSAGATLPTAPDGSVDVAAIPASDQLGMVGALKPKRSGKLTVTLAPGDYELFCNLTTKDSQGITYVHYKQGMHQAFQAG